MTFEQVVADKLAALEPVLKSAKKGATATAACYKMLNDGDIRNVDKRLAEAEDELRKATEGISAFRSRWQDTGLSEYFGSDEYLVELTRCLEDVQVDYHRLDDVLYVYPALVRLDSDSRAARIDKKTESRLRPKTLAGLLQRIQNRPSEFPAGRFLGSLFRVYKALAAANLKRSEQWTGKSLFLRDIYDVLSAAPGSDYSEQEFARDLYLLDASGAALEVRKHVATLQASSGTRDERRTLSIITRDGQSKLYCTIRFDPITR